MAGASNLVREELPTSNLNRTFFRSCHHHPATLRFHAEKPKAGSGFVALALGKKELSPDPSTLV